MRILACLLVVFGINVLAAQSESGAILNSLESKYRKANLSIDLTFEVEVPNADNQTMPASLVMQNNQYRFKLGKDEILSDGEDLYAYNAELNEVQINDMPEDQGMFSPQTILSLHDSGAYDHVLVNTFPYKGKTCHLIEFKPTAEMSDIVKYKMLVDKNKNEITEVSISMRDGARYTFLFEETNFNASIPQNFFVFNEADYPEAYVEDLRLD